MDRLTRILLTRVEDACRRRAVDAVLLSGGVDSSLLAACYRKPTLTVTLRGTRDSDAHFSQFIAQDQRLDWTLVEVNEIEATTQLRQLMRLRNTFDRGIFNDLAIFLGLLTARSRGWRTIASGEGAELLFAGYDWLVDAGPRFRSSRQAALSNTRLSETMLARQMGMRMVYPYLSPEVVEIAVQTDLSDCVSVDGRGHLVTKIPLRHAASQRLPTTIAWRERSDVEFGSGFASLGRAVMVASERFEVPAQPCDYYWDDVHRALHRIFAGSGLRIPMPVADQYPCHWCGGAVDTSSRHCPTCGAFPADELPGG